MTSDVGQHQMWAAQSFHFREPCRWINSGGLGPMGFGLPAAMGAKVGCPDLSSRAEVMQICEIFHAKVVDVTKGSVVVEVTGT